MQKDRFTTINMIGAGNVAWHLAQHLSVNGFCVQNVFSQTKANAEKLAQLLKAEPTDNISTLSPADITIFSLKDSAYQSIIEQLKPIDSIVLHTSGSLPKEILSSISNKYGVLYPFQTFNKFNSLKMENVPFCIEASDENTLQIVENLVVAMHCKAYHLTLHQRERLHLAGVFACNFTNALYGLAEDILTKEGIDFEIIKPLIEETALKIRTLTPKAAQTGPAARKDYNIINKHIALLDNDNTRNLYRFLSQLIQDQQERK